MTENPQYDALLGGDQDLPPTINLMRFTAARHKEIEAMKQSLKTSKGGKLLFQKLPKHMRRRVMSHNAKRLPRRLREIHLSQLKKSGLVPKAKRPSRKYRRRPRNLMEDYARRQRRIKWLETHIWHAKRFHMVERWGYKLAESPCDKAFRACYRATAKHCLLQDISYVTCLEICGNVTTIVNKFKCICDATTGLSIGAKAYLNGIREGEVTLFKLEETPRQAIGTVLFNWKPQLNGKTRTLWVWVHAAYHSEVLDTFKGLFALKLDSQCATYKSCDSDVTVSDLRDDLNRFRLTGPLSQAVLQKCLKPVDVGAPKFSSKWLEEFLESVSNETFANQVSYWKRIENVSSPAQLPPHLIVSLIATDPRYNFPKKRTKALPGNVHVELQAVCEFPADVSVTPVWDGDVRKCVKESKISNARIAELRSELLVPGTDLDEPGVPVPYILIQRPGNRSDNLGYCSGWDIIVPSGWAQPTWISLVMWGARAGGLRESESMHFETGNASILPPDTKAGMTEDSRLTELSRRRYFSMPPNKRTNYNKFSIVSPFKCNWNVIVGDWKSSDPVQDLFVLRDKKLLQSIQEALGKKSKRNLSVDFSMNCLLPVKLKVDRKGVPRRYSLICLPLEKDLKGKVVVREPVRRDELQNERKEIRQSHRLLLKKLRRRRVRAKQNGKIVPIDKELLMEYKHKMQNLWLPESEKDIRRSCSREVMGFVTKGDFSFTAAHGSAVGYIALGSLRSLLSQQHRNKVLVRNTTSRQYRIATLEIIT